jgi:hypothetical protein
MHDYKMFPLVVYASQQENGLVKCWLRQYNCMKIDMNVVKVPEDETDQKLKI